jgi:hypothetical protein
MWCKYGQYENCQHDNNYLNRTPLTAICQKDCDPVLKVTASVNIPAAAVFTSLSPDGMRLLVVLSAFLGTTVPQDTTAFILRVSNGTIITDEPLGQLVTPAGFSISSAAVSPDFTRLAVIFESDLSPTGIINVYDISDNSFTLLSSQEIITDNPGNEFYSGSVNTSFQYGFCDNETLGLTLLTTVTGTTGTAPIRREGVLQLYDVSEADAGLISETPIGGFSNGPVCFDLCQHHKCHNEDILVRRRFLAVGWSETLDPTGNPNIPPPQIGGLGLESVFEIYEVVDDDNATTLELRDRVELPAFPGVITIPNGCCPSEILIALATSGRLPNQPTLAVSQLLLSAGISNTDRPGGITILRFNGDNLCEAAFQPVELGTVGYLQFDATGKYLAAAFNANVTTPINFGTGMTGGEGQGGQPFIYPNFIQVFRVLNQNNGVKKGHPKCNNTVNECECRACIYPIDIPRPAATFVSSLSFSFNGEWFAVSGTPLSTVASTGVDVTLLGPGGPINNVQLYRLIRPCGCPCPNPCNEERECLKQNRCDKCHKRKKHDDDNKKHNDDNKKHNDDTKKHNDHNKKHNNKYEDSDINNNTHKKQDSSDWTEKHQKHRNESTHKSQKTAKCDQRKKDNDDGCNKWNQQNDCSKKNVKKHSDCGCNGNIKDDWDW